MSDKQNYPAAKHYAGEFAEDYDTVRMVKPKWQAEQQVIEEFLSRTKPGETLLDVPFGTGRFLELCQKAGLKITGADISQDMLDEAAGKLGDALKDVELIAASAEKMPFDDNAFDYLICNRFIKWLPSKQLLIPIGKEFRRVTAKQILLQMKLEAPTAVQRARDGLSKMQINLMHSLGLKPRAATSRYSLEDIRAIFAGEGWEISEVIKCPGVGRDVVCVILGQQQAA